MTGDDIRTARTKLGKMWGLNRPLHAAELGRLLKLQGRDPGATVLDWEAGRPVTGPVSMAIEAWLAGHKPSTMQTALPAAPP